VGFNSGLKGLRRTASVGEEWQYVDIVMLILISERCGRDSGGRYDRVSVTAYSEGAGQQPVIGGGWWVQIRQNMECDGVIEISKMIVRGHKGGSG
jgi:hypothetical protein